MTWVKAEYECGSLFSYRMPDFSSQYALSSLLPGPSTVKLALVATAIETTGMVSYGEEIFGLVKNAEVGMVPPKKIAVSNVLIKRLKQKKGKLELESTFGIRGYVHFSGPISIYLDVGGERENIKKIKTLLGMVRRLGTSDSIVWCLKSVKENPPKVCIKAEKELGEVGEGDILVIPVKDLNPDPEIKFEHVNIYDSAKPPRRKNVYVKKFYPIPISKRRQGKNWITYEIER